MQNKLEAAETQSPTAIPKAPDTSLERQHPYALSLRVWGWGIRARSKLFPRPMANRMSRSHDPGNRSQACRTSVHSEPYRSRCTDEDAQSSGTRCHTEVLAPDCWPGFSWLLQAGGRARSSSTKEGAIPILGFNSSQFLQPGAGEQYDNLACNR